MAVRRVPRGSGITQTYDLQFEGDDAIAEADRLETAWEAERAKHADAFEAATAHIKRYCEEVLAAHRGPMEHDSDADFAARIVGAYRLARQRIDEGHAAGAAAAALVMGAACTAFDMKKRFEPAAVTGQKVRHESPGANKGGRPPADRWRDIRLAEEFLRLKPVARKSDSALKADIGRKAGLGRSASISAIDRGIEKLSGEAG